MKKNLKRFLLYGVIAISPLIMRLFVAFVFVEIIEYENLT